MAALLQAERLRERLVRGWSPPEPRADGRRFRIGGDTLVLADEAAGTTNDIVAVPSEQVLLLRVELPLPSARARLEALPFAIEDRIADPLDSVHVALGPAVAPQTFLAAVVRHDVMRDWIGMIEDADAPGAALVPDALLLPAPPDGCWAVAIEGERALVRCGDGTGFAMARAQLPLAWSAGGRPACIAWSDAIPEVLGATPADAAPDSLRGRVPPIDLRQGVYSYRRPALSGLRRRVMTVAAAGIVAHGAIAAADTLALRHQAHVREVAARTLLSTAMPGMAGGDGALAEAAANLPPARPSRMRDPLLPLLARVSTAVGPVDLVRIDYDRQGRRLVLTVPPGTETRLSTQLASAGFAAAPAAGQVIVTGFDS